MSSPTRVDLQPQLVLLCRSGFEPECAAEITDLAARRGIGGYVRTERGDALVRFVPSSPEDLRELAAALRWDQLIFGRQVLPVFAELRGLPAHDRVSPVLAALAAAGGHYGDFWIEHADSDAGRPLSALCRSFGNALRPALKRDGWLQQKPAGRRLHLLFLDGDHLLLAATDPARSAPWPMGIPRLRQLPGAPSRSALKLDEALYSLLSADERERWLKPGMRAVDLGAAPGGWSYVLARAHLSVRAIDNGPMAQSAMDTGLIEHIRADGFRWRPDKPVDWLVCDMVEQPARVAELIGDWLEAGLCRHAVFNLKLPMKKRYPETRQALDSLAGRLTHDSRPPLLRARQLYHDREEITALLSLSAARTGRS